MHFSLGILVVGVALLLGSPLLASGASTNTTRTLVTPGKPHAFPESYQFDRRDGWESVMATSLRYNSNSTLKRASKGSTGEHASRKSVFRSLCRSVTESMNGIAGTGEAERVMITWYSGHDLLNPSCWSDPSWTPTDQSFVASLTLDGWDGKPQCFDFLEHFEVCSTSSQCTFARVVDSCAGCEEGSKHVDLTQAVFERLGSLEDGILTGWMRRASEPDEWDDDLWGPKDE